MSAGASLQHTDQFLCPICLDVLNDPVSTPCGHNFCSGCITRNWNFSDRYSCPMCKEKFDARPQLRVNTFIREVVRDFRRQFQETRAAGPGQAACDVCPGPKLRALKTCLDCLASYCQVHLEPHLTAPRLKLHHLIEPVLNVEDRVCHKHNKPLELFCRTDQACVCSHCPVFDHKGHAFASLTEESAEKKVTLGETNAHLQEMIQLRQQKIQEIAGSLWTGNDNADREKAEGVQVFTTLKTFAERELAQLNEETDGKQRALKTRADGHVGHLNKEISKLTRRSSEIEQLMSSDDHHTVLRRFPSLKEAPRTKDLARVGVQPPSYEGTAVRAMMRALEYLQKELKDRMQALVQAELGRVRQCAVDLTLDPYTAHPWLVLTDDEKQVHCGNVGPKCPENPGRFSKCACVLARQSFSSGRFYFEVGVEGKTEWDVGVARASADRKGDVKLRPQFGYWVLRLRNVYDCKALADEPVSLSVWPVPRKVGVFVDYEEGLVSFYDVGAPLLLYSFTGCSFNSKIHPFFFCGLNEGGSNSAPLVICPVS
ncbi:E3 ubiquitin-protein ligase TRIM39-like [Cololabis saira]|uniref:E3 ubiquitin-protein ligase TRIM39-like n=1 Tax=Cololabis saira TaxID=129043 RepID=UPI002AD40DE0|nr:E3 ubiquitin-protein ligase TRIM39-like [Cololabis saira]